LTYGKRVPFQASASEGGHGRESTLTLRAMEAPKWFKEIWPRSALIIAVRSDGKREIMPTEEPRYYVASLSTTATTLAQHVQYHGPIERTCHWVRDTQLREDDHRYRERNGVQVLAGLCTVALNLLCLNGFNSSPDPLGAVSHNMGLSLRLMCCHGQGEAQSA